MRPTRLIPLLTLAVLASAGPVAADSVYHTERLLFTPVGDASGSGMVVNIHPNGPEIYARERYTLTDAAPNETYQVFLLIYAPSVTCTGTPFAVNTASLQTNVSGNGSSQGMFRPEDVAALRGLSFGISWEVRLDGDVHYETDCTVVTLD